MRGRETGLCLSAGVRSIPLFSARALIINFVAGGRSDTQCVREASMQKEKKKTVRKNQEVLFRFICRFNEWGDDNRRGIQILCSPRPPQGESAQEACQWAMTNARRPEKPEDCQWLTICSESYKSGCGQPLVFPVPVSDLNQVGILADAPDAHPRAFRLDLEPQRRFLLRPFTPTVIIGLSTAEVHMSAGTRDYYHWSFHGWQQD